MKPKQLGNSVWVGTTVGVVLLLVFLTRAVPNSACGEFQQVKPEPAQSDIREPRIDRYGDPLPPGAVARLGTVRLRYYGGDGKVAVSPDGQLVIASDGAVWEVATGQEVERFRGKGLPFIRAFSADGKILVGLGQGINEGFKHWDVRTGELIRSTRFDRKNRLDIRSSSFSEDCRVLCYRDGAGGAGVLDVATGRLLCQVKQAGMGVAVSSDGTLLAAGGWDKNICIYDVATGKLLQQARGNDDEVKRINDAINFLAFSPDGRMLASVTAQVVHLWDVATGKQLLEIPEPGRYGNRTLAFSPDSRLLATESGKVVRLRDVGTGAEVLRLEDHQGSISGLAFSRNGKVLASSGNTTILWDVTTGRPLHHFEGHQGTPGCLAFSPDGRQLVSGGQGDQTAIVWDLTTHRPLHFFRGHFQMVLSAAFSPDGRLIATGEGHRTGITGQVAVIRLWDPRQGQLVQEFFAHANSVRGLAFSPDGKTLASVGGDERARIWDVAKVQRLHQVRGKYDLVRYSADGKALLTAGDQEEMCLWRADLSEKLHDLGPQKDLKRRIVNAAFLADGKTICSREFPHQPGKDEDTPFGVRFWDRETGKLLRSGPATGHTWGPDSVAFSPDGKLLAVHGGIHADYKTILVYDLTSGAMLYWLAGHRGGVASLCFSPDGKFLASGAFDTTVLIWDLSRVRLEHQWRELAAGPDKARQITKQLAAAPGQAVPFLRERLREAARETDGLSQHIARLDPRLGGEETALRELEQQGARGELALWLAQEHHASETIRDRAKAVLNRRLANRAAYVEQLLVNLGSTDDEVREPAYRELWNFGPELVPVLRRLELTPDEEFRQRNRNGESLRQRIQQFLQRPRAVGILSVEERARSVLASVGVLEQIGTAEARQVLEELARGPAEASLTRLARASLDRLSKPQGKP